MTERSRRILLGACAAAVLLLLVFLLQLAERGAPNATITSFPNALWYALTTLTTVGYGDTFPVTAAGRLIGTVFQLLSLGLLVFLVGLIVSLMRGRFLPLLRLRAAKKRPWYLFADRSAAAFALAENLKKEDPAALTVFAGAQSGDGALPLPAGAVTADLPLAELVRLHKNGSTCAFFLSEDGSKNEALAETLSGLPCRIFCRSDHTPDTVSEQFTFFDRSSCLARLYWQQHPVRSVSEKIILIGDGPDAEALLLQGLQNNVIHAYSRISYVVFGDFGNFRRNHPYLDQVVTVGAKDSTNDSLHFIEKPWNTDGGLLAAADRIILCCRTEAQTASVAAQLLQHFPVGGDVYARLSAPFSGATVFGSDAALFTPELVMRQQLDAAARRLHEIYRAQTGSGPRWQDLNGFTRRSNLASADHLREKIRFLLGDGADGTLSPAQCRRAADAFAAASAETRDLCRRMEHERWLRFHLLNNWQYDAVRDNKKRHHPMIVPFDTLSPEDQAKDDYAWELLKDLTDAGS